MVWAFCGIIGNGEWGIVEKGAEGRGQELGFARIGWIVRIFGLGGGGGGRNSGWGRDFLDCSDFLFGGGGGE